MIAIKWNNHFNTGIPEIDRQHLGLLGKLNEVAPDLARYGNRPVKDFSGLHKWLSGYAREHFATEEHLMEHYKLDPRVTIPHCQSHQQFVEKLNSFSDSSVNNMQVTGNHLLSFIAGWLVGHILGEDQTLGRQLQALESVLSPERAYREAGGYRTNPSIEAVTDILVQVYGQLFSGGGIK
ncbi:bacteriohemerythrin [Desulfonatronovibrio magnus]|uniref:bacteriohemerythrin n=1 Tax=Desulfonatronovibrio magnus TaxID=698827 RepID=UPI0005EAF8FE|nr:hemerythrin family protein [Desulfonatronovibrio magnus]